MTDSPKPQSAADTLARIPPLQPAETELSDEALEEVTGGVSSEPVPPESGSGHVDHELARKQPVKNAAGNTGVAAGQMQKSR